ncbi:hypothetical protein CEE37_14985 [candidate division LCP-89 bacterium B3_LCP]|uniref:Uncharacterized protein n=1 Tax=candidate division LCP-89 bacterium B3_LCP TaxID=2012998 RepID=A0A532UNW4_UNCL8|nr:MAG: hypothetical protein CEE37_14985 [candidate division LCP-89 bacterium B3_LCP]
MDTEFERNLLIWLSKSEEFKKSWLARILTDNKLAELYGNYICNHPKELKCRTELSKIYLKQKRYKEAEKVLLECLQLKATDLNSRTELGRVYLEQKRYKEAEKVLLECLQLKATDLNSRTELGRVFQRMGRYKDAEDVLLNLLAIDKRNYFAMAELISVYDKMQDPDKCLQKFNEFLANVKISKGREHQAMFNNIFKLCKRYSYPEKAKEYFEKYKEILDERNKELYQSLFGE